MNCAYCGAPATEPDHLITNNQARASDAARRCRDLPRYIVPCCHACNMAKYTLHRIPERMRHLHNELEAITGNTYGLWDGQAETLYGVHK